MLRLVMALLFVSTSAFGITFDEQHCERGSRSACEAACDAGAEWACDKLEDQPVGETDTETEVGKGCDPWLVSRDLKQVAATKAAARWVAPGTPSWRVTSCQEFGEFRYFAQFNTGIRIQAWRFSHGCPKSLSFAPGFSNIGMEYTMVVTCILER